jgi:hypothetical protein
VQLLIQPFFSCVPVPLESYGGFFFPWAGCCLIPPHWTMISFLKALAILWVSRSCLELHAADERRWHTQIISFAAFIFYTLKIKNNHIGI